MTWKREPKSVAIVCVKCGEEGKALEKSIWKCPACGQSNAVLAEGPVETPGDEEGHKPKETLVRRPGFWEEAARMLQSIRDDHPEWDDDSNAG